MDWWVLLLVIWQVLCKNGVINGMFYMQVMWGVVKCDYVYLVYVVKFFIVIIVKNIDCKIIDKKNVDGICVIMLLDNCWDWVDIKIVGFLFNVMVW